MKTIVLTLFAVLPFLFLFQGCDNIFGVINNTPVGNFNLLFSYLNRDYAYRDNHAFTMNELKSKYMQNLLSEATEQKLAEIFVRIEKDLMDPHFICPEILFSHYGNTEPDYSLEKIEADRDKLMPSETGFKGITVLGENYYFTWGRVTGKMIGYVYIKNLSDEFGETLLEENNWRAQIESILMDFASIHAESIIVDIRSNAGGSNFNGLYIANRFSNTSNAYMIEEYEGDHGHYEKTTFYVKPEGGTGFREGKVALLINNYTCSGGEMFVLAMQQRKNLMTFGTPTMGCAGAIIDRDLYNGWNFRLTSSRTTGPNGEEYFKVGLKPDFKIIDDESTVDEDEVIQEAIDWLTQ